MSESHEVQPIVRLRGVEKVYRQGELEVRAVDGVDLDILHGEFTALSGPSGSGKTTILNLTGALDDVSAGEIFVEGRKLQAMSRTQTSRFRRDRVGFVFQAYNLIPVLSAFENAELILTIQGVSKTERLQRVSELFEAVGLQGLENRRPSAMSGGQQQRVAIVRAIVTNPAIVLADEPTANVDSRTASTILDIMERLNREKGNTFLFSSHDPQVIERARRVIRMQDGRIISDEYRR